MTPPDYQYLRKLFVQKMKGGSAAITTQAGAAMTTNETLFFRDKLPFDHFRDSIMPEISRAAVGAVEPKAAVTGVFDE